MDCSLETLDQRRLMDQILSLHRVNPLCLSDIKNIVGDVDCGKFHLKDRKIGKKVTFSTIEEFVNLLKDISGVGVEVESESTVEQIDTGEELAPPMTFSYKRVPHIVVFKTDKDSGAVQPGEVPLSTALPPTLSPNEFCNPDYDFYDRCGCLEDDMNLKEDDSDCLSVPTDEGEGKPLEHDVVQVEESRTLQAVNFGLDVDVETREGLKLQDLSYKRYCKNIDNVKVDLTEGANVDPCEDLKWEEYLQNDIENDTDDENGADPNKGSREIVLSHDMVSFDQFRNITRIDEVEEDDFPLGGESQLVSHEKSSILAKPPSSGDATEAKFEVHMEQSNDLQLNKVYYQVKLASHHQGKIEEEMQGSQVLAQEGSFPKGDEGCVDIPGIAVDQCGDADSDSDIPSVIEIKPATDESLEELANELGIPSTDKDLVTTVPTEQISCQEQVEDVQTFMNKPCIEELTVDTNEDLRDVHGEMKGMDHLDGERTDIVAPEEVLNDNEDARSICRGISGVDHLKGVARLLRSPDSKNHLSFGQEITFDKESKTLQVDPVSSPPKSCVDENEDSRRVCSGLTGVDHLSGINDQIKEPTAVSRVDINEDDRSMPNIIAGVDHLDSGVESTTSATLHRTESFTSLDQIDESMEGHESFKVAVKISHPDVHEGGSSVILNSSSLIESFAANIQAIYEGNDNDKDQACDKTKSSVPRIKSHEGPPQEDPSQGEGVQNMSTASLVSDKGEVMCHQEILPYPEDSDSEENDGDEQQPAVPIDSVSITTQTDSCSEEGVNMAALGPWPRRRSKTSKQGGPSNPKTTLVSNIHFGLPSQLLEVDIAVQKTTFSHDGTQEVAPSAEQGSRVALDSQTDTGSHEVVREESRGHMEFRQSHEVTFNDMISLVISCFDIIFWVCLAVAVVVYEMCRRGA